jgi:hypothetical protein
LFYQPYRRGDVITYLNFSMNCEYASVWNGGVPVEAIVLVTYDIFTRKGHRQGQPVCAHNGVYPSSCASFVKLLRSFFLNFPISLKSWVRSYEEIFR